MWNRLFLFNSHAGGHDLLYFIYGDLWKSHFENEIFFVSRNFFFINFDFKNECENEFKDNDEKSSCWSRNRVFHKKEFNAQWPRNGHAASVGVNGGEIP